MQLALLDDCEPFIARGRQNGGIDGGQGSLGEELHIPEALVRDPGDKVTEVGNVEAVEVVAILLVKAVGHGVVELLDLAAGLAVKSDTRVLVQRAGQPGILVLDLIEQFRHCGFGGKQKGKRERATDRAPLCV